MTDSIMFHEGNRRLQDQFDSRRISDRLEQFARKEFTPDDRAFIESAPYFFLATADAEGRPDCSFKGGMPGFVAVTGPSELAFPDYDGNGMFKSLGNILVNADVGLLFIAMHGKPQRLRVNGTATVSREDPLLARTVGAQLIVRVTARVIFPNCPRYIPDMQLIGSFDLRAAIGMRSARARVEGLRQLQGLRAPAATDLQGVTSIGSDRSPDGGLRGKLISTEELRHALGQYGCDNHPRRRGADFCRTEFSKRDGFFSQLQDQRTSRVSGCDHLSARHDHRRQPVGIDAPCIRGSAIITI